MHRLELPYGQFLYALRREVVRSAKYYFTLSYVREFLYALRREVVRSSREAYATDPPVSFYTPFGVRWFGALDGVRLV